MPSSDEFDFTKEVPTSAPEEWKYFDVSLVQNGEMYWVHDGLYTLLCRCQSEFGYFEDEATGDIMYEDEVLLFTPLHQPAEPSVQLLLAAERRQRKEYQG